MGRGGISPAWLRQSLPPDRRAHLYLPTPGSLLGPEGWGVAGRVRTKHVPSELKHLRAGAQSSGSLSSLPFMLRRWVCARRYSYEMAEAPSA